MPAKVGNTRLLRFAALAGMIGPPIFGAMLLILTLAEYDFMKSLRWDPLYAATTDWPSGLALGPNGGWMIATFLLGGLTLALFGLSLRVLFPGNPGPALFFVAGLAVMLLSSLTDPTYSDLPPTLHGRVHDAAYVLLGLSFLPGLAVLARVFGKTPGWESHAVFTWVVLGLTLPTFVLKGFTFYVFLAGVLTWLEWTAYKIWQLMRSNH